MNMKEAFPNLKFVGEGAKEFEQKEITAEQLEGRKQIAEQAKISGERLRTALSK